MSILLLCNVGTRDIELQNQDDLPSELIHPKNGLPIPRQTGEYLQQAEVFQQFKNQIRLPMVEKALHLITPKDKSALSIVLFATNQPEMIEARFRDQDTVLYAAVMRDVLFDRYQRDGLIKKRIRTITTAQNPANYDFMHDFYQKELPILLKQEPDLEKVYLLVAGGTPQMNTMLMLVGSEVFATVARPIYVSPERDRAMLLNTVRQIYAKAMHRNLLVLFKAYAYTSALELIEQSQDVLEPWQSSLLHDTLTYAITRRNIDLAGAAAALDETLPGTHNLHEMFASLQQEVTDESDPAKLQETIYLAQIAYETHNWLDFLTRLHRFSEGCMQLMAEDLGVQWSKSNRSSYKKTWWDEQRAMLHDLKLAETTKPDDAKAEDSKRAVDRQNLRTIVQRLAEEASHDAYLSALNDLVVVDKPIPLRNRVVHDFIPLSQEEIEEKAGCPCADILLHMRQAYQHTFAVIVPEAHPYQYVNLLCERILGGDR